VTHTVRPARPAGHRDLVVGSALAIALCLIGIFAAGGTELAANTWVQVVLLVVGAGAAGAVLLVGGAGPRWGAGSLAAFVALAALTYASIAWSVQPATSWLEANRSLSYLAAFGTALALARLFPRRWPALVGAVAAATTAICAYALLLKTFPGSFDRIEQLGRLIEPLDYWNAIGLIAALGIPPCLWAGARPEGPRWGKALAAPAIATLISALLLSYSRGSLAVAVVGAAGWFALVPLRLRGALILGIGTVGGAVVSGFALPNHALTADYVPLAQRVDAGHWLGLVLALVLLASAAAGWIAAERMEHVVLAPRVRRRASIALLVLVGLLPLGGVGALAASRRGLTGEVSHIWHSLTNTRGGTGDQPGRLVELSNSRPHYWSLAVKVGRHHLFAGSGALGFATASRRYSTDAQPVSHAHGYVVETFADLGLLGLAVSLALLGSWAIAAARPLRAPRGPPTAERLGMLTLLCVTLVFGLHSLLDWTWFIPGTAVIALTCAGWLAGRGPLDQAVGTAASRRRLSVHPGLGVATVALAGAAVFAGWVVLQPWRASRADSEAISALLRGDGGAALTDAQAARASDPVSVEPLFLLSRIYGARGDATQARAELVKATTVQPENSQTWSQLGGYDLDQHARTQALAELQRAHQLDLGSTQIASQLQRARAASG